MLVKAWKTVKMIAMNVKYKACNLKGERFKSDLQSTFVLKAATL